MTTQTEGSFEGWAVIELMGRRKLGGYVQEATVAGSSFLRIDVPGWNDDTLVTQFYSAAAVYCLTPTTEHLAKQFSLTHQPVPFTHWELPSAVPSVVTGPPDDDFYPDNFSDEYEDDEENDDA